MHCFICLTISICTAALITFPRFLLKATSPFWRKELRLQTAHLNKVSISFSNWDPSIQERVLCLLTSPIGLQTTVASQLMGKSSFWTNAIKWAIVATSYDSTKICTLIHMNLRFWTSEFPNERPIMWKMSLPFGNVCVLKTEATSLWFPLLDRKRTSEFIKVIKKCTFTCVNDTRCYISYYICFLFQATNVHHRRIQREQTSGICAFVMDDWVRRDSLAANEVCRASKGCV